MFYEEGIATCLCLLGGKNAGCKLSIKLLTRKRRGLCPVGHNRRLFQLKHQEVSSFIESSYCTSDRINGNVKNIRFN